MHWRGLPLPVPWTSSLAATSGLAATSPSFVRNVAAMVQGAAQGVTDPLFGGSTALALEYMLRGLAAAAVFYAARALCRRDSKAAPETGGR